MTSDTIGFGHFYDCSVPTNFTLFYFIAFSVYLGLGLVSFHVRLFMSSLKGKLALLGKGVRIFVLSIWLHVALVYFQAGFFEGAIVTWVSSAIIGFSLMVFVIPMFLDPILRSYSLDENLGTRLKRKMMITCAVHLVILSVICLTALGYCRNPNPSTYNLLMLIMLYEVATALVFTAIAMIMISFHLKSLLPQDSLVSRRIKKPVRTVLYFNIILLLLACTVIVFCLLWTVYSSCFMWIPWSIQNIILAGCLPAFFPFFSRITQPSQQYLASKVNEQRDGSEEVTVNDTTETSGSNSNRRKKKRKLNRFLTTIQEKEESNSVFGAMPSIADL